MLPDLPLGPLCLFNQFLSGYACGFEHGIEAVGRGTKSSYIFVGRSFPACRHVDSDRVPMSRDCDRRLPFQILREMLAKFANSHFYRLHLRPLVYT
jgi:hypothetical protein